MKEFVEKPDFYDASSRMGGWEFSHTHMSSADDVTLLGICGDVLVSRSFVFHRVRGSCDVCGQHHVAGVT